MLTVINRYILPLIGHVSFCPQNNSENYLIDRNEKKSREPLESINNVINMHVFAALST